MKKKYFVDKNIVFYDGECGFCHESVKILNKLLNKSTSIYFSPLQGETAKKIKLSHKNFPNDLDSIVFLENNKVYKASKAFYKISKFFIFPFNLIYVFNFMPQFISDFVYYRIAAIRKKILGKIQEDLICEIPSTKLRKRFLK